MRRRNENQSANAKTTTASSAAGAASTNTSRRHKLELAVARGLRTLAAVHTAKPPAIRGTGGFAFSHTYRFG
jgi:hypothetical protein